MTAYAPRRPRRGRGPSGRRRARGGRRARLHARPPTCASGCSTTRRGVRPGRRPQPARRPSTSSGPSAAAWPSGGRGSIIGVQLDPVDDRGAGAGVYAATKAGSSSCSGPPPPSSGPKACAQRDRTRGGRDPADVSDPCRAGVGAGLRDEECARALVQAGRARRSGRLPRVRRLVLRHGQPARSSTEAGRRSTAGTRRRCDRVQTQRWRVRPARGLLGRGTVCRCCRARLASAGAFSVSRVGCPTPDSWPNIVGPTCAREARTFGPGARPADAGRGPGARTVRAGAR